MDKIKAMCVSFLDLVTNISATLISLLMFESKNFYIISD